MPDGCTGESGACVASDDVTVWRCVYGTGLLCWGAIYPQVIVTYAINKVAAMKNKDGEDKTERVANPGKSFPSPLPRPSLERSPSRLALAAW